MNTLIALGTGAAWLYSTFAILFPSFFPEGTSEPFYDVVAVVIALYPFKKPGGISEVCVEQENALDSNFGNFLPQNIEMIRVVFDLLIDSTYGLKSFSSTPWRLRNLANAPLGYNPVR
jgi:hypothetical protein